MWNLIEFGLAQSEQFGGLRRLRVRELHLTENGAGDENWRSAT